MATAAHIVLNGASVVSELNSHVSMGLHQAAAVAAAAGAAIVEPQPIGVNPDQVYAYKPVSWWTAGEHRSGVQIEKHSSRINYMTVKNLRFLFPLMCIQRVLQDEKGDKERCTVCLVDFEKADELRSLQCQHIFHVDCIDRYVTKGVKLSNGN